MASILLRGTTKMINHSYRMSNTLCGESLSHITRPRSFPTHLPSTRHALINRSYYATPLLNSSSKNTRDDSQGSFSNKQENNNGRFFTRLALIGGVTLGASIALVVSGDKEEESTIGTSKHTLDTSNTKVIFAKKSTSELLFSLIILKLCSIEPLIQYGPQLLTLAEKIHCEGLIYWVIKKTFFKQFVAGEDLDETLKAVEKLYESGLSSILDYSVESGEGTPEEFNSHVNIINETINFSALAKEKAPFSCLKITGLTYSALLEKMSALLDYQEKNPGFTLPWKEEIVKGKNINVAATLPASVIKTTASPPQHLTREDLVQLNDLLRRLDAVCKNAATKGVALLVDAEQSYYQAAISFLAIQMAAKYNKKQAIIHNTYQMYLKDGLRQLERDLSESKKNKYFLGVKLVRGAYIDSENERAKKLNYPSPILPTIQDTHNSYNSGVNILMNNINQVSFMIATHNEDSVKLAFAKMQEKGIPVNHKHVHFAQLYGMCDHVSYAAAAEGLLVSKYVAFGPVKYVLPYLIRRMQENKGFVSRTVAERQLLSKEIKRRMFNIGN